MREKVHISDKDVVREAERLFPCKNCYRDGEIYLTMERSPAEVVKKSAE